MRKKTSLKKKGINSELIGKSIDYQDGWQEANIYFEHIVEGGSRFGSAPFRIFVEAVAESIRKKESMSDERVKLIDFMLKWSDTEFNKGVHDLLIKRANEYRGFRLIEVLVEKESELLSEQVHNIINVKM